MGGKGFFSHGTSQARGICVMVNKKYVPDISNYYSDSQGRLVAIDISLNDKTISIVAIYASNQENFFNEIEAVLKNRSEFKFIRSIGDFNFTLDVELDRLKTYNNNNKNKEKIENFMQEFSLCEIWRLRYPEKREFSWFKSGNIQKASRIDFALVSMGLDQHVVQTMYLPRILSDYRCYRDE